ncbi:hypothetical protein chiPu_0018248 [Chiloscyllium punctatum]|uniref:Uncharacterized protein n=1 Tax=Chiloscyllium punctatum TaxID=137246 RepID=A0A401RLW4_CHIPU|nr:hypothetical protein [Chiloscyllium punctatum]
MCFYNATVSEKLERKLRINRQREGGKTERKFTIPEMEAQMQEFKALAGEMSIILSGSHGEVLLQKAMMNKAKTLNRYLEFERSVKQLLTEIQQTREKVALKVIEIGEEQQKSFLEVQKIQEQWKNSQQQYIQKEAELKLLQQDLEELERTEKEITKIEEEVAEDTTVIIPSTNKYGEQEFDDRSEQFMETIEAFSFQEPSHFCV